MAIKFPLVLYGTSIQEIQPGDSLDASASSLVNASQTVLVDGVAREAKIDTPDNGTPYSIPCRDASGDINSRRFNGTSTSALFADLAEKYLTDVPLSPGTVVAVGGAAEVRAATLGDRAFGAVSTDPAFMMNSGLEGGTYIALKGRVPVKIHGPVNKGDRLIACHEGCAGVASTILKNMPIRAGGFPDTFAIALETNLDPGVKLVECIIL